MFLVSRELVVEHVEVVEGSPVYPHKPVVLTLAAAVDRPWVRVLNLPKAFPTQRPQGCWSRDHAGRWAQAGQDVNERLGTHPDRARADLTGAWRLFLS